MSISRREFLRIAGLSTLAGIGGQSAWELLFPGQVEAQLLAKKEALQAKRWALLVDMRKLDESTTKKCIEVCHRLHNVPDYLYPPPAEKLPKDVRERWQVKWIWTDKFQHAFPDQEHENLPEKLHTQPFLLLCNQCQNPPCVRVCPTQATFQRADGIVMMDMHRCIGCRYCMAACPFGARSFNFRDPRPFIKEVNQDYPTRERGVVEKCDFCAERLAKGIMPACVEVSNGALVFGDLGKKESNVRDLLRHQFTIRRKVHLGTNPQVYYIV